MKQSQKIQYSILLFIIVLCSGMGFAKVNYSYHSLYVYNFTKYIQWPEVTREMVIGVAGGNPEILEAFEKMATAKSSQELRYLVRIVQAPADVADCHILYIPEAESSKLSYFRNSAAEGKLIVTEGDNMLGHGSMINFIIVDNKLRFELNQEALDKAGLKISSQLKVMAVK